MNSNRQHPARYLLIVLAIWIIGAATALAQPSERRIALVIGNGSYPAAPVPTAANDAGLIAQTLQAAGFDVVGARDLDADSLRHTFRDFLEKAASAGPETVALVYVAGRALQYEGENFIVPVDARIETEADVSVQAVRLSDYIRPLIALQLKARIVIIDGARENPFARSGRPLASGLAMVDAEPGTLIAFNAAPGTVAPERAGPYGAYAQALAEMIRQGGLSPTELFDRVRQRVNEVTGGAFIPWDVSRLDTPFVFFQLADDAPPPTVTRSDVKVRRAKAIRDFDAGDAYHEALDRDTLDGYTEFVDAYPREPVAKRVRVIIAARREAIVWRRTFVVDTADAYWSYLNRYPKGPHAWDARRRLRHLAVEQEAPPSTFIAIEYDVPPPPPEEIVYVERPVLYFSDPFFELAPPPPPRIIFLAPAPLDFILLPPPPPVVEAYILPVPFFVPVARWCDPPRYIAPPPSNIVYNNIHNAVVVNQTIINATNVTNTTVNLVNPGIPGPSIPLVPVPGASQTRNGTAAPGAVPPQTEGNGKAITAGVGVGLAAAALAVALPPTVAKRQGLVPQGGATSPSPTALGQPLLAPDGKALPQPTVRPLTPRLPAQATTPPAGSALVAVPQGKTLPAGSPQLTTVAPSSVPGLVPPGSAKSPSPTILGQPLLAPNSKALPQPPVRPLAPRSPALATTPPVGSAPVAIPQGKSMPASSSQATTAVPGSAAAGLAAPSVAGSTARSSPGQATSSGLSAPPTKSAPNVAPTKKQPGTAGPGTVTDQSSRAATSQGGNTKAKTDPASKSNATQLPAGVPGRTGTSARQGQQPTAQDSQRRTQQTQAQAVQQRQQQAAQEAQRRAQQQQAQAAQQRQQQGAQEAQRRAQQQQAQAAQQRQQQGAQEAQRRAQQQQAAPKCGVPGTPPCRPN